MSIENEIQSEVRSMLSDLSLEIRGDRLCLMFTDNSRPIGHRKYELTGIDLSELPL